MQLTGQMIGPVSLGVVVVGPAVDAAGTVLAAVMADAAGVSTSPVGRRGKDEAGVIAPKEGRALPGVGVRLISRPRLA